MKWSKTITLSPEQAVRDVRVTVLGTNGAEAETRDRANEDATFERGIAEGEKRLSEQLLRQRSELLQLQNGVLASLRNAVSNVIRDTENAVVELAVEVARKIVSDLPVSRDMVEGAIRGAMAQVEESAEFHVYLHADDLAMLQQCNSPVLTPDPGSQPVHFHASPDVSRGGCIIQTRFGIIDARRETKIDLIRQSLNA